MPRQKGPSKNHLEQKVRDILAGIFRDNPGADLTKADLIKLAKKSRRLPADWVDGVRERAIAMEIGHILRSEKFTDEHGVELRTYDCYKQFVQKDGKEVQQTFWRDIHTMNRRQMMASQRALRKHARDVVRQADARLTYWNRNVAPDMNEKPIQKRLFED